MYGFLINDDKLRTERIKSLRCSQDVLTLSELVSVAFNVTFTLTSEKVEATTTHWTSVRIEKRSSMHAYRRVKDTFTMMP